MHSLFECLFTVKEALIIIKNVNTFLLVLILQYNGMQYRNTYVCCGNKQPALLIFPHSIYSPDLALEL